MAEEKNCVFPMIAIVAIVAIVGIVVMFMQSKGVPRTLITTANPELTIDEEGNLIGEAGFVAFSDSTCTDSDGGKNYYVKGMIHGYLNRTVPYNYTDACVNMWLLKEQYCNLNKPASLYYDCSRPMNCTANCSYCKNGACIR
jgi:hypothetical protein